MAVQGNLDPAVLLGPARVIEERVGAASCARRRTPGHVFNLGHGILPETPPEQRVAPRRDRARPLRASACRERPPDVVPPVSADLLAKYDRPGPRYTSYPTAVEFHDGVRRERPTASGSTEAARRPDEPLSLYLHLPFCEERCIVLRLQGR